MPAPARSPLPATIDLNAGVDAFMDDAINVFSEMGTRYASFFPFSIWLLILYSPHLYQLYKDWHEFNDFIAIVGMVTISHAAGHRGSIEADAHIVSPRTASHGVSFLNPEMVCSSSCFCPLFLRRKCTCPQLCPTFIRLGRES